MDSSNGSNGNNSGSKGTTTLDHPIDPSEVTYRIISDDEVPLMAPLYQQRGWPTPNPDFDKVLVAETQNKIVAFATVGFVLHAKDFWVAMEARGTGLADELMAQVVGYIERDSQVGSYVCTAKPGSFGARLAEKNGMTLTPLNLFTKVVHKQTQ